MNLSATALLETVKASRLASGLREPRMAVLAGVVSSNCRY